jgi:hypothetical protein
VRPRSADSFRPWVEWVVERLQQRRVRGSGRWRTIVARWPGIADAALPIIAVHATNPSARATRARRPCGRRVRARHGRTADGQASGGIRRRATGATGFAPTGAGKQWHAPMPSRRYGDVGRRTVRHCKLMTPAARRWSCGRSDRLAPVGVEASSGYASGRCRSEEELQTRVPAQTWSATGASGGRSDVWRAGELRRAPAGRRESHHVRLRPRACSCRGVVQGPCEGFRSARRRCR